MVQTVIETKLLEFKELVKSKSNSQNRKPDRATRKLLLYLFTGTRGGHTRLKIIKMYYNHISNSIPNSLQI